MRGVDAVEARWLDEGPSSTLSARWPLRAQAPWWRRLLGGGEEPERELGWLRADREGLVLSDEAGQVVQRLAWEEPFGVVLTRWPGEGGAEVNVVMRSSGGSSSVAVRSLWPMEAVSEEVPVKQEIFPFVDPVFFGGLWRWLGVCASIHGVSVPRGVDLTIPVEALEGLESRNEVFVCAACQSASVRMLAARVYLCLQCGYEGGPGMAEWMKIKRRQAMERLPAIERVSQARGDVREARTLLLSAQGTLRALTGFADVGGSRSDQEAALSMALGAHRLVAEARQHLEDAMIKDPPSFGGEAWEAVVGLLGFADKEEPGAMMVGGALGEVSEALRRLELIGGFIEPV